ncbi:Uncharacterized protein Adt_45095 [Abeliophyllum distichum]|uniref:Uncharacterized protein n=1 Tax=Abeliophyllum distichum TaxID=126358 RepID=A0ABD1PCQ6_9LAMI
MHDKVVISLKSTDTINIHTITRMKIVKENRQWVAKTKGFDAEYRPSTMPFEGGEAMDEDDHDEEDAPSPSHPSNLPSSHILSSSSSSFFFSEDYYNLLNDRIDSLTSMVDDLQHTWVVYNNWLMA